ncbi:MAG: arsenite methyltransferase [Flavisolibacter sp.]
METQDLKELVRQKYSEIALQDKERNKSSCCGSECCSAEADSIMAEDYTELKGYNAEADLGLGCGLPTKFAKINTGDVVVDLGSGAGNDAFIARHEAGDTGKIIGIDFTPAMIERARKNAEIRGINNVEFRQGDIESIPVTADTADVIVSNCVLNLVPNKDKVFKEMYRILKPGGHFSISDIVLEGELPVQIRQAAEMYAGCVSGAIQKQVYLDLAEANGFKNIVVQKDKKIELEDDVLLQYLSRKKLMEFRNSGAGIRSITVYAEKPKKEKSCCGPECCI